MKSVRNMPPRASITPETFFSNFGETDKKSDTASIVSLELDAKKSVWDANWHAMVKS